MNKYFLSVGMLGLSLSLVLVSCNSRNNDPGDGIDTAAVANRNKAAKVFYAIPSPSELTAMIKATGANFDKNSLNPAANESKYSSLIQKSLNLGVYGADLSYASTFDQTQESMVYMNTCKKLADGLGITGAISENTVKRMEKNLNNKDSLIKIISDTYLETDIYLKNNDRASTSALVVAGAWIEGLYISVNIANKNANNAAIMKRIGEQKLILENLIGLLESNQAEDNEPKLMAELRDLQAVFNKLSMTEAKGEVKTDEAAQKTTIGSNGEISLTPDQLKEITAKITAIRNRITS